MLVIYEYHVIAESAESGRRENRHRVVRVLQKQLRLISMATSVVISNIPKISLFGVRCAHSCCLECVEKMMQTAALNFICLSTAGLKRPCST